MNIIFLAIPLAIILGTGLFFGFIWAVQSGQMDDLETPAHRILIENENIELVRKITDENIEEKTCQKQDPNVQAQM